MVPTEFPVVLLADRREDRTLDVPVGVLATLLAGVLAFEGASGDAECSLSLVDPDEIAALKAEHLDGDGEPTDVLSFPIDGPSDPGDGKWMVGDVVLCPSVAAAQADGHAGSAADELALLVVHGGLHLSGWDHDGPQAQANMWARERELLTGLHGPPARDPWSDEVTR
ncbi:MAG: rRNA maturation RNase YbeY [Actinomycetes bacterium]